MQTVNTWLENLNLFQIAISVGLTAFFTSYLQAKTSKKDMLKGIDVSERNKAEIIAEIRGQISSIRQPKN